MALLLQDLNESFMTFSAGLELKVIWCEASGRKSVFLSDLGVPGVRSMGPVLSNWVSLRPSWKDLNARQIIFCQWRSLPGSVCLNSVIRFDCLMCLMKSFLRIWSKSFLHKSLPNLIHPTSPSWSAIALTSTMSSSFSSIPYLSQIVRSFEDADEDEVSSTWLIRYEQNHDICIS